MRKYECTMLWYINLAPNDWPRQSRPCLITASSARSATWRTGDFLCKVGRVKIGHSKCSLQINFESPDLRFRGVEKSQPQSLQPWACLETRIWFPTATLSTSTAFGISVKACQGTWGLLLCQEMMVAMPMASVHRPMRISGTMGPAMVSTCTRWWTQQIRSWKTWKPWKPWLPQRDQAFTTWKFPKRITMADFAECATLAKASTCREQNWLSPTNSGEICDIFDATYGWCTVDCTTREVITRHARWCWWMNLMDCPHPSPTSVARLVQPLPYCPSPSFLQTKQEAVCRKNRMPKTQELWILGGNDNKHWQTSFHPFLSHPPPFWADYGSSHWRCWL